MTTTRRRLLVSSIVASLLFVVCASCSHSEQDKALERQKRIEQQEREDAARAGQSARDAQAQNLGGSDSSDTQSAQAEQAAPESPPEPEKTTNFIYFSGNSKVVCICRKSSECGMTFWGCGDGKVYACMHNAIYQPVEVEATKDNTSSCED